MKKFLFFIALTLPVIGYGMQRKSTEQSEPITHTLDLTNAEFKKIVYTKCPDSSESYTAFFSSDRYITAVKRRPENTYYAAVEQLVKTSISAMPFSSELLKEYEGDNAKFQFDRLATFYSQGLQLQAKKITKPQVWVEEVD